MGENAISPIHNVFKKYKEVIYVNPYANTAPVVIPVENTFIGGVAGTIYNASLLATKLAIDVSRITNFSIIGSDIKCKITGSYTIPDSCFYQNTFITSFIDSDNLVSDVLNNAFRETTNIKELIFNGVITLSGNVIDRNSQIKLVAFANCLSVLNTFYADYYVDNKKFYIPKVTSLGINASNNNVFYNASSSIGSVIYCHPSLETTNAGGVEGDLTYAISKGAIVRYITNFTAPNPITNLSIGTVYATALQLNFTAPSSTNAIDYYEVWLNGVKTDKTVTASGQYVTGLTVSTSYSIQVKPVDIFLNKSTSNTVTQITNTTSAVPTTGLVSYYKLDANSNDSYGSNNGTATSVTYESGLVGQRGVFNGSTSKVDCTNNTNVQLTTGSISCIINSTSAGSSFRGIVLKSNAYGLFLSDGVLITYDWGSGAVRSTGINLNDGLNHFLLMTFQSGVTNGTKIYIDAVLKLTTTITVSNQSSQLTIGYNSNVQFINAKIDEVALYNVILTENQGKLLHNAGNGITL